MGDLKARIKAKLLRRHSTAPSVASSKASSKSGRPDSRNNNKNYAASSVHTSHEAGEGGKHKENADGGEDARTWSIHSQSNSHSGSTRGRQFPGIGRSRPSTAVSAATYNDQKSVATPAATDASDTSLAVDAVLTPEARSKENVVHMAPAAADAGDANNAAVGSRGDETLNAPLVAAGSSNSSTSTSNKKTASSPSGSDQQAPSPTNTNPSTAPAINTILPSINEQPATPTPPAIESPLAIDSVHKLVVRLSPNLAPVSVDTGSASLPTASSHEPHRLALTSVDSADTSSIDILTPVTPGVSSASPTISRPETTRRQSLVPVRQQALIETLLDSPHAHDLEPEQLLPISATMVTRKIWVKRPGASATMITINEDDLVDDVRDMILRKYANSLGRQFDSPDLTLRIVPKEQNPRQLQPDEPMSRTLDAYFPGGQTAEDALLIDIPPRRTPKASPNPRYYSDDANRPHESGTDYFPPFVPQAPHSHHSNLGPAAAATIHFPPSMAIVNNGQLPPLPSPGGTTRRMASSRPKMQRLHTASPVPTTSSHVQHPQHVPAPAQTNIGGHAYSNRPQRSRTHSGASADQTNHAAHAHPPPAAPPLPTPPIPEQVATPPPPRVASPRPSARPKKKRAVDAPALPQGMLNGSVPPINVLIVEDNIINLKLLEAFVKRLKVRWQTAMNGRDAVNKWRTGGFHLVLMDIQLPIMNGLDATREIRRIEKVNHIGVFSSSASRAPQDIQGEPDEKDKLPNTEMFKSPVIIVALTASSLQSDRHEALAAGCNDFLTKPVNFVWLERKVMEWGCMQALIDFDGWRKWKDFSAKAAEDDSAKKAAAAKAKAKKNRQSLTAAPATAAA